MWDSTRGFGFIRPDEEGFVILLACLRLSVVIRRFILVLVRWLDWHDVARVCIGMRRIELLLCSCFGNRNAVRSVRFASLLACAVCRRDKTLFSRIFFSFLLVDWMIFFFVFVCFVRLF